jgi:hypothetical protein
MRISLTDGGKWIFSRENHLDLTFNFSFERSMSLIGDSLRSCSTSLWRKHVQSKEAMLGLVWPWRSESFMVEVVCYFPDTHDIDILQDYTSQGIAIHILIWDPRIGVLGSPDFD